MLNDNYDIDTIERFKYELEAFQRMDFLFYLIQVNFKEIKDFYSDSEVVQALESDIQSLIDERRDYFLDNIKLYQESLNDPTDRTLTEINDFEYYKSKLL